MERVQVEPKDRLCCQVYQVQYFQRTVSFWFTSVVVVDVDVDDKITPLLNLESCLVFFFFFFFFNHRRVEMRWPQTRSWSYTVLKNLSIKFVYYFLLLLFLGFSFGVTYVSPAFVTPAVRHFKPMNFYFVFFFLWSKLDQHNNFSTNPV